MELLVVLSCTST